MIRKSSEDRERSKQMLRGLEQLVELGGFIQEQIEEERRIFYVGMTRAKKTLELHYLTGTKEHPKFPSRFIEVLLK